MRVLPVAILAVCTLLFGCSPESTGDSAKNQPDSLECIIPEAPTTFDTAALTKMTDELVKIFESDLKIFHEMRVERKGHEYYSNEWWYFDEKGRPKYFKGEWGSESLMGKYYYSFDTIGINLGYENTNNHEASDELIRFCSKMTPYTGYRTFAEIHYKGPDSTETKREVDNMTAEDLAKKSKEILSFLGSSQKSMKEQIKKYKTESDGSVSFYQLTPDIYEPGRMPDEETITLKKELLKLLVPVQ